MRTCDKKDSRSRWQIVAAKKKKHEQIKQILISNFLSSTENANNKRNSTIFRWKFANKLFWPDKMSFVGFPSWIVFFILLAVFQNRVSFLNFKTNWKASKKKKQLKHLFFRLTYEALGIGNN